MLLLTTAFASRARADDAEPRATEPFTDPRKRTLPPMHRFRMGIELAYVRLSAALDENTGDTQRFHLVPLGLDFAYQLQFLKYAMLRPSLGFAGNVGNSMEAMPFIIHPQLHTGYQGRIVGVALGYGFFQPIPARKDVSSAVRGGLGQPIITNNHHVGGEISATTRVDSGALSFQLRLAGVRSHLQHFALDEKGWRFMLMFNAGWYFGDGSKQRARRAERRRRRMRRRGTR